MDIKFTIDASAGLVSYSLESVGTPDQAREFLDAITSHPDFVTGYAFLGDCRKMGPHPDTGHVRAFAKEVRSRSKTVGPCRWAMVVSNASAFTAVRLCGLLTYGSCVEFAPFIAREQAQEWLGGATSRLVFQGP